MLPVPGSIYSRKAPEAYFDEVRQARKGPLLVELGAKGEPPRIELREIPPLHPMRVVRGAYEELRARELKETRTGEYLRLVLTDRRLSPETVAFFDELFRSRGSILMDRATEYDPFRGEAAPPSSAAAEQKGVDELFCDFYTQRSGGTIPGEDDRALLAFAAELCQRADLHAPPEEGGIDTLLDFILKQEGRA